MTNPYAAPQSTLETDEIDSTDKKIAKRVKRPAMALLIMSSIYSVTPAVQLISFCMIMYHGGARAQAVGSGTVGYIVLVFGLFATQLVIAIGAGKMTNRQSYHAARTACVLACIPWLSPFIILGLPFGIWGMRVLAAPEVRASFRD